MMESQAEQFSRRKGRQRGIDRVQHKLLIIRNHDCKERPDFARRNDADWFSVKQQ